MVDDDRDYERNIGWHREHYRWYSGEEPHPARGVLREDVWGDDDILQAKMHQYFQAVADIQKDSAETIIDIGALNGRWEEFLFDYGAKIICVDLFDDCFKNIKDKYPNEIDRLEFYVTRGTELHGIETDSVDVVFSVNSLTRLIQPELGEYFDEFYRVLKPNAKVIVNFGLNWDVGQVERFIGNYNEKFNGLHLSPYYWSEEAETHPNIQLILDSSAQQGFSLDPEQIEILQSQLGDAPRPKGWIAILQKKQDD